MPDLLKDNTILREASWKNYMLGYVISILLIPVLGIGLIGLYLVRKRQKRVVYGFSDIKISKRDEQYQQNIDLVSIKRVSVQQNWFQQKMGVGNLELNTSASSMILEGMENPHDLKTLLDKAIQAQLQQKAQKEKSTPRKPKYNPGTMERMNYLTGLWQQGLVSEEDYEKERKHFE